MKVKEYREAKGLTQEQMASILGIKQGSYSDKENGKKGFKAKELLILEMVLEVPIKDMYVELTKEIEKQLNKKD